MLRYDVRNTRYRRLATMPPGSSSDRCSPVTCAPPVRVRILRSPDCFHLQCGGAGNRVSSDNITVSHQLFFFCFSHFLPSDLAAARGASKEPRGGDICQAFWAPQKATAGKHVFPCVLARWRCSQDSYADSERVHSMSKIFN